MHIFVPQLHHDVVGKNAQLPHRGFQSFAYLQANGKICKRKKAFRRGYLAHKIETRCHTICTPWHYSRGTDASCNRQMFSKFCVLAGKWQNLQAKKGVSARLPCTQNLNTLQYNLHTVYNLWGTDGKKGIFQTQVSNAKTPCAVRNFLPIGQIFSFGGQFRWETYQQTVFRNIAIATACDLKVN